MIIHILVTYLLKVPLTHFMTQGFFNKIHRTGISWGAYGLRYNGGLTEMGDKTQRWRVQKSEDTMIISLL